MKRGCVVSLMGLVVTGALWVSGGAQAAEPAGRITVVSHVDILPDSYRPQSEEKAAALFREQTRATRQDKGLLSYVFLRQVDAPNHFTIVETWADADAYAAHVAAKHTVDFRTQVLPYLGSPFDARVHEDFK